MKTLRLATLLSLSIACLSSSNAVADGIWGLNSGAHPSRTYFGWPDRPEPFGPNFHQTRGLHPQCHKILGCSLIRTPEDCYRDYLRKEQLLRAKYAADLAFLRRNAPAIEDVVAAQQAMGQKGLYKSDCNCGGKKGYFACSPLRKLFSGSGGRCSKGNCNVGKSYGGAAACGQCGGFAGYCGCGKTDGGAACGSDCGGACGSGLGGSNRGLFPILCDWKKNKAAWLDNFGNVAQYDPYAGSGAGAGAGDNNAAPGAGYPGINREDAVRYLEGMQYYPPYHLFRSPRDFYMFDVKYGIGK